MSSPRSKTRRAIAALVTLPLVAAACGGAKAGANDPTTTSRVGHGSSSSSSSTTTTQAGVQAVNGKVTVLEIGDSLGIDLGWGLQWALASDSHVTLVQDAKGDSGLVNTSFYNWPAVLDSEIQSTRPQIVVVFLGANDVQNFYQGNTYEAFGSASWKRAYGARVATMMSEASSAGAKIMWVGMPIMQPSHFSSEIAVVDSVFQAAAAKNPQAAYFSSWSLFSTPSGQYNGGTTDVAGTTMELRDPDGIHLADGGEDLLAAAVARQMKTLYKLP